MEALADPWARRVAQLARRAPVPEKAITRGDFGSVLSWSADFNSEVLAHAVELDSTPVLVHSRGRLRSAVGRSSPQALSDGEGVLVVA